jgi:hypothetical protein
VIGFREGYLDHAQLTSTLKGWAETHAAFCRLRSIGTSTEGRDLWLLIIGKNPDVVRPALWVDGNMHAMELAGSSVALAFAEELLALHSSGAVPSGVPAAARPALQDSLVYVLPRMSPDGAEAVLKTGRFVRSSPVDDRLDRLTPRFKLADLDGDGLALSMRIKDPAGDFIASTTVPGLMLPRGLDDEGPFYKIYPEAIVENWDGHTVPAWTIFDDNRTDLNRNFPWSWAPEGEQVGAGAYATSTPEARAVVDFTSKAPHLMAWLNLHTYGGVYIRPLGHQADNKMDRDDLEVFRQVGAWVTEHTGYATVSGYEEFLYQPDKPIRGDVSDYAYHQLGCLSFAVELWDLMARAGLERKKPFIDTYQQQGRKEIEQIAAWDREHNGGRTLRPWTPVKHPQLGEVEVGGIDGRFGVWNPPPALLDDTCKKNTAVFHRVLAMLPRVTVSAARNGNRVEVVVRNVGYLATCGLASAKKLALAEPISVEVTGAIDEPRRSVGHLDGWGHGLWGGSPSWPYQTSTAPVSSKKSLFVVGDGPAHITVGSCRVGFQHITL